MLIALCLLLLSVLYTDLIKPRWIGCSKGSNPLLEQISFVWSTWIKIQIISSTNLSRLSFPESLWKVWHWSLPSTRSAGECRVDFTRKSSTRRLLRLILARMGSAFSPLPFSLNQVPLNSMAFGLQRPYLDLNHRCPSESWSDFVRVQNFGGWSLLIPTRWESVCASLRIIQANDQNSVGVSRRAHTPIFIAWFDTPSASVN